MRPLLSLPQRLFAYRRLIPTTLLSSTTTRTFVTTTARMANTQGLLIEAYSAAISTPPTPAKLPEDASTKAHHRPDGKGFLNPWDRSVCAAFTSATSLMKLQLERI